MEIIILQLNNNKAYKLIENLEALDIVKVLKREKQRTLDSSKKDKKKPSEYAGSISKETAKLMIRDIKISRDEWERNS